MFFTKRVCFYNNYYSYILTYFEIVSACFRVSGLMSRLLVWSRLLVKTSGLVVGL